MPVPPSFSHSSADAVSLPSSSGWPRETAGMRTPGAISNGGSWTGAAVEILGAGTASRPSESRSVASIVQVLCFDS